MRSFPGKLFAKASTHGKRISVLSLITMIVFVLWGQKKFQSQGIIVPASAFTCPFFFLELSRQQFLSKDHYSSTFSEKQHNHTGWSECIWGRGSGNKWKNSSKTLSCKSKATRYADQDLFFNRLGTMCLSEEMTTKKEWEELGAFIFFRRNISLWTFSDRIQYLLCS